MTAKRSGRDIIFKPGMPRFGGGLAATGLAAALFASAPALAEAQDVAPFGTIGAFIGWTWDVQGGGGFTWGIEGRGGVDLRDPWACGAPPAPSFAAVARLGFVNLDPQLHFGGQAGVMVAALSAMGELSAGYRWGENEGFSLPLGLQLEVFAASTFFRGDPILESVSTGGGGFFPPREATYSCTVAGRALHDEIGHAALPQVTRLGEVHPTRDLDPEVASALASEWEARAKAEWASVPAFMQLADQLRIAGAPRSLIHRALCAADDELRHAIATARTAVCYGGVPLGLGRVTSMTRTPAHGTNALVRLAVESFVDGCQAEGTAARIAEEEAARAHVEPLRAMNARIAHDEARHAELAWDVLTWTVLAGGDDVRHALDAVRDVRPVAMEDPDAIDLTGFGVLDRMARHGLADDVHANATRRLDAVLG
jgi:hypothetical protein